MDLKLNSLKVMALGAIFSLVGTYICFSQADGTGQGGSAQNSSQPGGGGGGGSGTVTNVVSAVPWLTTSGAGGAVITISTNSSPVSQINGGTGTNLNLTIGSIVFQKVSGGYGQNNGSFFWDDTNLRLGIGTSSPLALIHSVATNLVVSASPLHLADEYGVTNASFFVGRHARGTTGSPTAVQTDDSLVSLNGRGYGATGFSAGRAIITGRAGENWSDSAQGAYWSFFTTTNTTATASESMRLDSNGNLGIGTTSPSTRLHVVGTITANSLSGVTNISFNGGNSITNIISASTSLGFANALNFGQVQTNTLTLTGIAAGDKLFVGWPSDLPVDSSWRAGATAANTISIYRTALVNPVSVYTNSFAIGALKP